MANSKNMDGLTRDIQEMPEHVALALKVYGLQVEYDARPAYQRNDYLSWIGRAAREATREKRLNQMLDELRAGDVYMKMAWGGKR